MSHGRRDDPAPDVERSFDATSSDAIEPMTDDERAVLESLLNAAFSVQFCRKCGKPHDRREDAESCSCYQDALIPNRATSVLVPLAAPV